ncbi:slit homolog 2 protein-like [Denticeps clupeoides]|uniref:LRRNT domain-containing protein n=1 Tax=Denticeps clupeoides TaxID=299321 RepID=A0AAY4DZ65_9TELE|nr:slit homolog 2 protein-like [Denticeps clupeoides]
MVSDRPTRLSPPAGAVMAPSGTLVRRMFCFAVLLPVLIPARSSRICSQLCRCYERSDLVDCRGRGFGAVPRGLPHGTWLLDLGDNVLTEIRAHAFAGLWSLRILVLSDSNIRKLHAQAFYSLSFLEKMDISRNVLSQLPADFSQGLTSVRELRLDHNTLHALQPPSLEHLENLEKLDLSHNRIQHLEPGAFWGLTRLRHLYLHGNQLAVLHEGRLTMLPVLEVLLLGNNNISSIDTEALAPLHSLSVLGLEANRLEHLKFKTFLNLHTASTHLQLAGNPWNCDCDLHRVFSKILSVRHLHVDDYRNVTCSGPSQLAGAFLAGVDSQLCMAETATVLVITGTVLVTVIGALVMAERNRKNKRSCSGAQAHEKYSG